MDEKNSILNGLDLLLGLTNRDLPPLFAKNPHLDSYLRDLLEKNFFDMSVYLLLLTLFENFDYEIEPEIVRKEIHNITVAAENDYLFDKYLVLITVLSMRSEEQIGLSSRLLEAWRKFDKIQKEIFEEENPGQTYSQKNLDLIPMGLLLQVIWDQHQKETSP